MTFKMKYPIVKKYLPSKSKRRPGLKNQGVFFIVSHDTGNPGSAADNNVKWMNDTANTVETNKISSAHIFIDDKEIIECVPLDEVAYHVLFGVKTDNTLYGHDANTAAIGLELCFGGKINNLEAYKRYVWYHAYLCFTYKLDPRKHITAHYILDPARKTDPKNGLKSVGKDLTSFIEDVVKELAECKKEGGNEMTEQKLTAAQEAVRQEATALRITNGKDPFRPVNQYYVWNALLPMARELEELKKRIN